MTNVHGAPKIPGSGITTRTTTVMVVALLLVSGMLIAMIVHLSSGSARPTKYPMATFVPSTTLHVGDALPRTPALADLIGSGTASVNVLARHHETVINFFASYCTACAAEMKTFATVAKSEPGVVFVEIDTSDPDLAKARSLVTGAGIGYPVLRDNAMSVMLNSYGVANLPTTFFISASGKVAEEVLGYETGAQLRAHLLLISGSSVRA